jgi:serine/threonine-protein kinase
VSCLYQTSLALDRTHKASVVHRDLKPENIFLCERDDGPPQIKVLDFGIAKFATSAKGAGQATNSVGTPLYMAPEQFHPGADVTPAADIYALGLLAYTLLVGTDYWHEELDRDENVFAFALIAMKGPVETPSVRAMRVAGIPLSAAFDAWFSRATAVAPTARFATASEAVRELSSALRVNLPPPRRAAASLVGIGPEMLIPDAGHTSRTTPAGSAATLELRVPMTRRRWAVVAGAAALVAVVVAVVAMRGAGTTTDKALSPVAAAADPDVNLALQPAAPAEAIVAPVDLEAKPIETATRPGAVAASKARPKSSKAPGTPNKPVKPIYSRD